MSKKLGENIEMVAGINPAALAKGSTNGITIDRKGFYDGVVSLAVGAASGTPTAQSVELKIQTGDASDASDMTDVTGAVIDAITEDNKAGELNLDLNGFKRYLRVVVTTDFTEGTTPAIPAAVTVALGNSYSIPV